MIRDTSIEAYQTIKQEGLLSRARLEVYLALFSMGPCTAGELFIKRVSAHKLVKGSVCARLTELRQIGVVKEVGEKICEATGQNVILWDVTSKLPKKLIKNPAQTCLMCGQKVKQK